MRTRNSTFGSKDYAYEGEKTHFLKKEKHQELEQVDIRFSHFMGAGKIAGKITVSIEYS